MNALAALLPFTKDFQDKRFWNQHASGLQMAGLFSRMDGRLIFAHGWQAYLRAWMAGLSSRMDGRLIFAHVGKVIDQQGLGSIFESLESFVKCVALVYRPCVIDSMYQGPLPPEIGARALPTKQS
jgi:hypothetical protein